MVRLFCGQDPREAIGSSVFSHSVWSRSSEPVSITQLDARLAATDGTNSFTKSRFLVPFLCDYKGWALWMDGADMLCLSDIAELWKLREERYAVQVVKHDYRTLHPVKYLNQDNVDYPRKNWSSVMLINCQHDTWKTVTPVYVKNNNGSHLHRFAFLRNELIGSLPKEWNHIVGEPNQAAFANVAHFSIGLPVWSPYDTWAFSDEWRMERSRANDFRAI